MKGKTASLLLFLCPLFSNTAAQRTVVLISDLAEGELWKGHVVPCCGVVHA